MKVLQFFYNGLLTGMPSIVYNPFTRANIHVPFNIGPKSLYINYKLEPYQVAKINDFLLERDSNLILQPVQLESQCDPDYYLSLNIYNCTSPVFMNDKETTRFEINTYVSDCEKNGTLILDYLSNELSIDPVNIFKRLSSVKYNKTMIQATSLRQNISLKGNLNISENDKQYNISDDLIHFSDNIFYTNGIFDKLFYDTSLIRAVTKTPSIENLQFNFLNISFTNVSSVFYFENNINFVGGVWYNIFKPPKAIRCSLN